MLLNDLKYNFSFIIALKKDETKITIGKYGLKEPLVSPGQLNGYIFPAFYKSHIQ